MIEVRNLVKRYGTHLAIDHLNFTIEDGKIYGFLGPNGAGKSTTMNIMTGYLGATQGQVIINGHDILKEPEEAKKHIGYLPEIPPLYMEMTVEEYLYFAAELKKIPKNKREEAVEEAMSLTKLSDVSYRQIANLSKGYRQRTGLAQALLGLPDIIILDEPTVGLDPKQIIEIRELIRSLAGKHTIILSSHILAEVREVCDHIMIISKGKLAASDTAKNLEHLMDEDTVQIQTKESVCKVKEILGEAEHITALDVSENEDGDTQAVIKSDDGSDIREMVFNLFASRNCPLLMLKTNRPSLEEIFLELTQGSEISEKEENEDAGNL